MQTIGWVLVLQGGTLVLGMAGWHGVVAGVWKFCSVASGFRCRERTLSRGAETSIVLREGKV